MEKELVTHSSILAWRIPWTEEPGGLESVGLQRVGHDEHTHTHTQINGNPFQYYCLGSPKDRGAWRILVHGVTKESD